MAEALYRKYRPQIFEDVVGQEHIERTIKNAIDRDKVSHAYLFTGPRGTGKTTTARLLAKALLCDEGPTAEPDGTCENCTQIAQGTHPDVYELDAASRTGVENVREEIIGRVQYAPTQGRYKVYIIDEVHMLSTAAFNALLKTLEEPPSHVVFILCTTDPQKVPETIHSRCQRFDFHRISVESIVSRLGAICVAEDVEFEGEALDLIAYRAEGGMRNALTSLEQLITFSDGKITLNAAERLLGSLDSSDMAEIVVAIGKRDIAKCFTWTASYIETGSDLAQFVRDLSEHIRNMYILSLSHSDMVLEVSESTRKELMQELEYYGSDRLARMLGVLGDLSSELRTSTNPRLSFEIALTRMVRPESDLTLEALAERIEELEKRKTELTNPMGVATSPTAEPVTAPVSPVSMFGLESQTASTSPVAPAPVVIQGQSQDSIMHATSEHVEAEQKASASRDVSADLGHSTGQKPASSSVSAAEQMKNPAALQRIWHAVLQAIKKEKAAYGVLFLNTKVNFDEVSQKLTVTFPAENVFAYSAAQKPEVYEAVSKALNQAAGSAVAFSFLQSEGGVPAATPAPTPAVESQPASTPIIPVPQPEPEVHSAPTPEPVEECSASEVLQSTNSSETEAFDEGELKDMLIQEYGEGVIFGIVEEE